MALLASGMSSSFRVSSSSGLRGFSGPGRLQSVQQRIALRWPRRSFAKAVFKLATTRDLIERLESDDKLRRLCGWPFGVRGAERSDVLPRVCRICGEFAESSLPGRLHEALVIGILGDHLVGHVSRDATAIEAREKPVRKAPKAAKPKPGRERQRKGEHRPREPGRLERQRSMTLPEMLAELPQSCNAGSKRNASLGRLEAAHQFSRRRYTRELHPDFRVDA